MANAWQRNETSVDDSESPSWTDYASTLVNIGGAELLASVPAAARYIADQYDTEGAKLFSGAAAAVQGTLEDHSAKAFELLSPAAQRRLNTAFASEEFLSHPFSTAAMKLTRMTPGIAAIAGSTLLGAPAIVALAVSGGGITAAQTIEEAYKQIDDMSDADLIKNDKTGYYTGLRTRGLSAVDAKKQLTKLMLGYKPIAMFAVGALAGSFGTPGQIARAVTGKAAGEVASGILSRTAKGAGVGAAAMGGQAAAMTAAIEQGNVDIGQKKNIDVEAIVTAGLEGALTGAIVGGPAEALAGRGGKPIKTRDDIVVDKNGSIKPAVTLGSKADAGYAAARAKYEALIDKRGITGEAKTNVMAIWEKAYEKTPAPVATMEAPPPAGVPKPVKPRKDMTKKGRAAAAANPAADVIVPPRVENTGSGNTPAVDETAALANVGGKLQAAPEVPIPPRVAPAAPETPAQRVAPPETVPSTPENRASVEQAQTVAPVVQRPQQIQQASAEPPARTPTQIQQNGTPAPEMGVAPVSPLETNRAPTPRLPKVNENPPVPKPRVLPDLTARDDAAAINAENLRLSREREARLQHERLTEEAIQRGEEPPEKVSRASQDNLEVRAKTDKLNEAATKQFEEVGSKETAIPVTVKAQEALVERARAAVKAVEEDGHTIPVRLKDNAKHNAAVQWLREAKDLVLAADKSKTKLPTLDHITEYIHRTDLLKLGKPANIKEVLARRRAEGEAKSRGASDVEQVAGEITSESNEVSTAEIKSEKSQEAEQFGTASEKEAVKTTVKASAKRAIKTLDEEKTKEVNPVKKIEITDELRAKYNTPATKTPKVAAIVDKVAAGKAKVAEEAAKTNPDPSPAQIAADNYKKGHPHIEGMGFAIETAKGEVRRGVDADGVPWEVTMTDHYTGMEGVKGADGENLDAFLGPEAFPDNPKLKDLPVVVITQKDLASGGFDEHKVMFGYSHVADAFRAYERAFSDGRALERLGDHVILSLDEFKAWKEKSAAERTKEGQAIIAEADALLKGIDTPEEPVLPGPPRIVTRAEQEQRYRDAMRDDPELKPKSFKKQLEDGTIYKRTVGEMRHLVREEVIRLRADLFKGIQTTNLLNKFASAVIPRFYDRIMAVTKDIPVHIMEDMAFDTLTKRVGGPAYGGAYYTREGVIVIPARTAFENGKLGGTTFLQTLLHEAVHAGFTKATWASQSVRLIVEKIALEARTHASQNGWNIENLYAFESVDEFIAEAFSNPTFQSMLAKIPASESLAKGIEASRKRIIGRVVTSLWDNFSNLIAKALGIPRTEATLMDAMLHVGASLENLSEVQGIKGKLSASEAARADMEVASRRAAPDTPWAKKSYWSEGGSVRFQANLLREVKEKVFDNRPLQEQLSPPKWLGIRTMDFIARTADRYFGADNPVRRIADLMEMIGSKSAANFLRSAPILKEMLTLQKKFAGPVWEEFTSGIHEETVAGVFADRPLDQQPHLGKNRADKVWSKAQHADLARRHNALPQELKALRAKAMKFFTDEQNAMSLGIVRNRLLKALGIADDGLAQRIFDGTTTPADSITVGGQRTMDVILEAKALAKIDGPYFPLMRRGDHVVQAEHPIQAPSANSGARPVIDSKTGHADLSVWDFTDRAKAEEYVKKQDFSTSLASRWVDATTGERYVTDANGNEVRVTKQDANAIQLWRVDVQNRHVDYVFGAKEAMRVAGELEAKGLEVQGVEPRRWEGARNVDLQSYQVRQLAATLESRETFKGMSQREQTELRLALNEASLRMLGSTRIQGKRLPRRNVAGYSTDLTANATAYAHSSASYQARLEMQPQLDAAVKEMRDMVGSDYGKSLGRGVIANAVEERVTGNAGFEESKSYSPTLNRILATSFIYRLASPAYSIMNATQVSLLTYPILAARHGPAKALVHLARAYRDIGTAGVVAKGFVATLQKMRPGVEDATFLDSIKSRLTPDEAKMLDYLVERNSLDPNAGLEVDQIIKSQDQSTLLKQGGAATDVGIQWLEGISRQMPKAIETINRTVSALGAYRMEMLRNGGDHAKATQYAHDVVNQTQFNYSTTNAAGFMRHPLARLTLQFKKFGMGVYQLLTEQIGKAIRNANPGDRAEALKALAYITAAQTLAAGTIGLPTEPIKLLLGAAGLVGFDINIGDMENWERQAAASMLGKTAGEMLTRGVTRGLPGGFAFDLSGRVGYNDLLTFGKPDSPSPDDTKTWVMDQVGGSPLGLFTDWVTGLQSLGKGDIADAAEKLVPYKMFGNTLKAYRIMTEGKQSASGRDTFAPYNLPEAALQIIGLRPGREAETSAATSQIHRGTQAYAGAKQDYFKQWREAKPADRQRLWGQIEAWNRQQPKEARLTRAQLDAQAKLRAKEDRAGKYKFGQRVDKTNKGIYDKSVSPYNVGP